MPSLTRAERLERIEEDDGNQQETVYLNTSEYCRTYHGDKNCKTRGNGRREVSRNVAQTRLFAPCQECILGVDEWQSVGGGISKLERLIRAGDADAHLSGGAD